MILSVVLVSHGSGGVIFSRFYGTELRTEAQQGEWLKKLRDATVPTWALLENEYPEQVATVNEVQVMYKLIGDVVLMLAGNEEHDALLMLELGRSMTQVITSICKITIPKQGPYRASVERRILQNYAYICLAVDEQIDDGDIDYLHPRVVTQLIRMKPSS